MKRSSVSTLFTLIVLICSPLLAATTTLSFDAPVPGTITDANGLGTGFTHRLPGTGGAIPANDPHMDLVTSPGTLRLTSTLADINQSVNLSNLEAPGILVPSIGSQDIFVTAVFDDVQLPHLSDQLMVYAGANATTVLRAGIHTGNYYIFSQNTGSGDVNSVLGPNSFSTGDSIEVTLSRQSGLWSLSWNNLSTASSGSLPSFSLPWLDASPDLYFGVLAANAGSGSSFVANIDSFSVTVVPEPSTVVLLGAALISLCLIARGRRFK